jgi:predicted DNA-binding transcriptional regulator YafY
MQTAYRHLLMLRMIPRYPRKIDTASIEQRFLQQGIEIHRRSIQRDLEMLSQLFPLVADEREKPFGWSWSSDAPALDLPTLSPTDALVYRMAADYLDKLLPKSVMKQLTPHFRQADQVLNATDRKTFKNWPDKIRSINRGQPLQPPDINPEIFAVVSDALLEGKRFQIEYLRRGQQEPVSWTINPLALVLHDRLMTLVCTVGNYTELKDVRMLHLHRIQSAERRNDEALMPDGFSIDTWIASGSLGYLHGTGSIKLKALFEQDATIHLEETPLSDDQRLTPQQDGMVLVEATVADTGQLRWWLLGFGGRIQVLEPLSLRDEMKVHAERMMEIYG